VKAADRVKSRPHYVDADNCLIEPFLCLLRMMCDDLQSG
jgi:hypothetical protein